MLSEKLIFGFSPKKPQKLQRLVADTEEKVNNTYSCGL